MTTALSLRIRLIFVILVPLVLIAGLIGAWAYADAQRNAAERFDRSLLSTALAISRDIAVTGGDALSEETRDLLRDTSGGAVFYHVYAPDGVFVTGYATPPVPPQGGSVDGQQIYYDAVYQGAPVRALRFTQVMSVDGLGGVFTFTVWQQTSVRDGFVGTRTGPVFIIIALMIGALAVVVWFGVSIGIAPLTDLEQAIARRSAGDLSPIRRAIPTEVTGIVGRLNALLIELSDTLAAKDAFISDAAHQLRNPIAGVLSLSESVPKAKDLADAHERSTDLREAARDLARLTDDLLTLERAKARTAAASDATFDPTLVLQQVAKAFATRADAAGITFAAKIDASEINISGDPVMFEQAILNLLNNALAHGGPDLTSVNLTARMQNHALKVVVSDDGKGIAPADFSRSLARFSQIGPSAGTGLGLPIAEAVAQSFGGGIDLSRSDGRFDVTLTFPIQPQAAQAASA